MGSGLADPNKGSKLGSDPFKSSVGSSESKSKEGEVRLESSSFFNSKSSEGEEDSFEVLGGEISEENSREEGQLSVASSMQKVNPFSSRRSAKKTPDIL